MEMRQADRLKCDDWVTAGLEALAEGGVGSVKIDLLAKTLGVTRGSFYWHFQDRGTFLEALLAAWERQQTEDVIARVEALRQPPGEALRTLLESCFADDGRLEIAFRAWATTDRAAAATVEAADQRRISYLAHLLSDWGLAETVAIARARIAYRVWLGEYALAVSSNPASIQEDIAELHSLLLR